MQLTHYNPIRQTEETSKGLKKINSCYQFVVTNVGLVNSRKQSCLCMRFTIDMCSSSLNWGTNHRFNGCVSSDIQTTNVYEFDKRECTKLTGPVVSLQLSERRQNRNEMAAQLTPGSWVAFKSTRDIYNIIWIGRFISKPEWENFCILKNDSRGNQNIEVASVGWNGYAINVQWYTQKVVGVIELVIDDNPPIVQSNSDLVLVGFDEYMHQVHGSRCYSVNHYKLLQKRSLRKPLQTVTTSYSANRYKPLQKVTNRYKSFTP